MAPGGQGSVTPRERVHAALEQLGEDEAAVLALIAERLTLGQRVYGPLRLSEDRRDFRREALEEVADAAVYAACGLIRRAWQ